MRQNLADFLHRADEILPDLTLGELIVVFEKVDTFLNQQLDLSPISDTMDLRSVHIRREAVPYEFNKTS